MMNRSIAVAAFVKTPGVSPLKTRLAVDLGTAAAEEFHRLATQCLEETLSRTRDELMQEDLAMIPYWSVAEDEARSDPLWSRFETIGQGTGGLGDRLHHAYSRLLENHDAVILIGADSPQMDSDYLKSAIRELLSEQAASTPFVMGPANDGGFVLWGGVRPIPSEIWQRVPYSVSDTASRLIDEVAPLGATHLLEELIDVDVVNDLKLLIPQLEDFAKETAQHRLLTGIRDQFSEGC